MKFMTVRVPDGQFGINVEMTFRLDTVSRWFVHEPRVNYDCMRIDIVLVDGYKFSITNWVSHYDATDFIKAMEQHTISGSGPRI